MLSHYYFIFIDAVILYFLQMIVRLFNLIVVQSIGLYPNKIVPTGNNLIDIILDIVQVCITKPWRRCLLIFSGAFKSQ